MPRTPRRIRTALAASLALLAACELKPPYERSNPFDPGSPYPMELTGVPDTVSAVGQRFQAIIQRDPPLDQTTLAVQWQASNPDDAFDGVAELTHLSGGEWIATSALSARLHRVVIGAKFNGAVFVGRTLIIGQLVDTLQLACGTVAAPVACDALPLTVGATFVVRSRARDAGGYAIGRQEYAMQRAVVALRTAAVVANTTVANSAGNYTFIAAGAGSTWIVIRSDHATDSVRVTVTP